MKELLKAGKLHGDAMTVTGKTLAENLRDVPDGDREVIRSYDKPMLPARRLRRDVAATCSTAR